MENSLSKQQIEFAEQLMQLVSMEDMARKLLDMSIKIGNHEMEVSARGTLQRTTEQIAAMVVSDGVDR